MAASHQQQQFQLQPPAQQQQQQRRPERIAAELFGGTVGGVMQVIVGHPLDTIKIRLQSDAYFKGPWHCIKETLKTEVGCRVKIRPDARRN